MSGRTTVLSYDDLRQLTTVGALTALFTCLNYVRRLDLLTVIIITDQWSIQVGIGATPPPDLTVNLDKLFL